MTVPVHYPQSEPARSLILGAFRSLSLNGKAEILFAAATLRSHGMETADLVAIVDDTFDVGVVHVTYTTALVIPASAFLTVIRHIVTGEHSITAIAARRPPPLEAAQFAAAAIGWMSRVIDVLPGR